MPTSSKSGAQPAAKAKPAAATAKKSVKPAPAKPAVKESAPRTATKKAAPKLAAKPAAKSVAKPAASASKGITPEQRRYYVEVAAYYIAERRGFHGGGELDDWVAAETEIERLLREGILRP